MFDDKRKQRLFRSPAFLFIYFTVVTGALHQFIGNHGKPFSWQTTMLFSAPTSLLMVFFTRRKIAEIDKTLGRPEATQAKIMRNALKTGIPPTDPIARKAFPKFLDYHYAQVQKSKKWLRFPIILIFGLLGLLADLTTEPHIPSITSVVLIAIGVWIHVYTKRSAARYDSLYQQLGIQPNEVQSINLPYSSVPTFTVSEPERKYKAMPFEPAKPEPGAARNLIFAILAVIILAAVPFKMHRAEPTTNQTLTPPADHSDETYVPDTTINTNSNDVQSGQLSTGTIDSVRTADPSTDTSLQGSNDNGAIVAPYQATDDN